MKLFDRSVIAMAVAALSAWLTTSASAAVLTLGIGAGSCGTWESSQTTEIAGENWILGYWSAANANDGDTGPNSTTGSTTDDYGIIALVRKYCADHPEWKLADAALSAWLQMAMDHE